MSMSSSATHTPAMNPGGLELKWIVSEWARCWVGILKFSVWNGSGLRP